MGWEDVAPSCLPLDVLDAILLGTCRELVKLVPTGLTCVLRGRRIWGEKMGGEEKK